MPRLSNLTNTLNYVNTQFVVCIYDAYAFVEESRAHRLYSHLRHLNSNGIVVSMNDATAFFKKINHTRT